MDLRVENIFRDEMKGDNSFKEKPMFLDLIFNSNFYKHQKELKETWNSGIKHGIEIGLRRASLEGQRIVLNRNTKDEKHIEFLEKFYRLAEQYKCAVQYHQEVGMVIVDRVYK